MKKKIITAAAAFAALSGIAVISSPNIYASEVTTEETIQQEENLSTSANYFRTISDELIAQGEFDYGGLHYTVSSSGYLTASQISNPSEVKELIIYYTFGKSTVTYSSDIDWTQYTNLENVIVAGANMSYCQDILSKLPSGTNLYAAGSCNFGKAMNTMTFKNLYLYYLFLPTANTITSSDFTNYLSSSSIENIYINEFMNDYMGSTVSTFNTAGYTNKNGTTLQTQLCTTWSYPEEVFYPSSLWDSTSPLFETKGYWSCTTSGSVYSMSSFTFWAEATNSKVVDLNAGSLTSGHSLLDYYDYNKVYMPYNKDYEFSGLQANELIIRAYSSEYLDFNSLNRVKSVRFIKSTAELKVYSTTLSDTSLLEKIYIPNEYKDKFSVITDDEELSQLVEYYDYESYEAPTNSYLSDDGNIYGVSNSKYTINEIESAIQVLKSLNIEVNNGDVIDTIMDYYEFPIKDYSNEKPQYSLREFDTVVLPKNMDATKVLEAFKFMLPLNHNQMCDSVGTTISFDTSNYTLGYNTTLPITVTFPDGKTVTKEVTVRVMSTEADVAYILDNDDVYIVSNATKENESIASLMSVLMENYLMETSVEYNQSPILNTTNTGYLAGNSYTASLSKGKAKVVISDVALLENTDDSKEETNDSEYQIKEISKIYTPTEIDATRLISQMRDFICTKNGEVYDEVSFVIGTNSGRTNKEDYTFSAISKLSDNYTYNETLSVEIIETEYNMGFVKFTNGDIAVLYNCRDNYSKEELQAGIQAFLASLDLNSASLSIPDDTYFNTTTYEGSYDSGKVYIVKSGVNLSFTTPTNPTNEESLKEGYVALQSVIYTKDYTMEDAMRALGKNILLKDGKLITDYEIEYTTTKNSNYANVTFKKDDTELFKTSIHFKQIESEYSYIFARVNSFDYGYLVIDKAIKTPKYNLNDVMIDVISNYRTLMTPFTTDANINFTKIGAVDVDGIYQVGNGSYYSYEYNVEIVNMNSNIKTNEVTVDGNQAEGKSITDKVLNVIKEFRTKFANNKAFKITTIVLGSIFGIMMLWVFYSLIRKFFDWLNK